MPLTNLSGNDQVIDSINQEHNAEMGSLNELEGLGKAAIKVAKSKKAALNAKTNAAIKVVKSSRPFTKSSSSRGVISSAKTTGAKTAPATAKPTLTKKPSVAGRKSIAVSKATPVVKAAPAKKASKDGVISRALPTGSKSAEKEGQAPTLTQASKLFSWYFKPTPTQVAKAATPEQKAQDDNQAKYNLDASGMPQL